MLRIADFLQGKKTYIVAAALVVYAVSGVVTGHMTGQEALLVVLNGLGLGALRAGVYSK